MAQTYTLEEAADKLDLSVEEFKRRINGEWANKVHKYRDGSTLRFRANEIEELARLMGLGSSEELPLADPGDISLPDNIGLADDDAGPTSAGSSSKAAAPSAASSPKKAPDPDEPLKLDDSDDLFLLAPDDQGPSPSSTKLKAGSDSDVRLEKAGKKPPSSDEESILTDEFELAPEGSGKLSGKSGKLSSTKLKQEAAKAASDSGKQKAEKAAAAKADDSSSEFELSLEPDSDEFELAITPDSSEEVGLGDMPATARTSGQSGINLGRPTDSGVSLEKKKPADDDEIDFELSLDVPGSGSSRKKLGSSTKLAADSDSEFELSLEEPSDVGSGAEKEKKGDIFEATDFEIPSLEDESASEAVALDEADTDLESSEFDLALDEGDATAEDESASEVVALDEDEVEATKALKKKPKKKVDDEDVGEVDLGDLDDEESIGEALEGVSRDADDDEEIGVAAAGAAAGAVVAARWGALPTILLMPTVFVLLFGALLAYETLHSVWGYQQDQKPTTPLMDWVAATFDMKPK